MSEILCFRPKSHPNMPPTHKFKLRVKMCFHTFQTCPRILRFEDPMRTLVLWPRFHILNFFENNRGRKPAPPPNEFWFFAGNLCLTFKNYMSCNICIGQFFMNFFPVMYFLTFKTTLKNKKMLNKAKKGKFGEISSEERKTGKIKTKVFFLFGRDQM